ncbi:hypothetical protein [Kitasatospora sp. GP82]|uniref:hypothetical protein n=1 Tax=Kitasatospora sp. GP82 TaxID=3035089 RepID=UPI0024760CC7|nr:hypothetical protein [Kitasatospora sp. GP82]MDH6124142.1 hypothetical protein [Kitasatospora sp. GP82]
MWEILADPAVTLGNGPFRSLRVHRAKRRLKAGLAARIPCSVRSERPGWPTEYTSGSILITPGRPAAAFGSREYPYLEFAVGGEFFAPEPDTWYELDWAAAAYQPPGDGPAVSVQAYTGYLDAVRLGLGEVRL